MNSKRAAVFYGWWVVLTSAVGLFWDVPVTVYSFTVFLTPLMQDFHAGRAAISLGFTLHALARVVSAPLVGWLIDRYGSRRVVLLSTAAFGSTLLANRAISSNLWQLYLFYMILGLFHAGPIAYSNVVSRWFDRQRGLALGLTMAGIGFGAMVMPSFAQQLIAAFGWRAAYAILGFAVLFIPLPASAVFLMDKPEDLALLPDGAPSRDSASIKESAAQGLSAYDAWHSGAFWFMVCAFFLVGASVTGCMVHATAMLSDRGVPIQTAVLGSSFLGAAVLIGRLGTGYLLDRIFAPHLAAVFFGGAALGIGLLWLGTTPMAFAGVLLVGLGLGAEVDVIAYLTSRYFGLRAFSKIYSSAFAAFTLAAALGPLVMGVGFDLTGAYNAPLGALFASTLVATVMMTRLGPYRYNACRPDENEPVLQVQAAASCSLELAREDER